jgi:DNA-binding beta-propeller fold protein YncE
MKRIILFLMIFVSAVLAQDNLDPYFYYQIIATGSTWNISTAAYTASISVSSQDGKPRGVVFSSDGTKMYMMGYNHATVYEYNLSVPFNVSTAAYASLSISVGVQDSQPLQIVFSPDGTKLYMLGNPTKSVYEYVLSTAWNISTAVYASLSVVLSSQDGTPQSIALSSDGTKLYMLGNVTQTVYQYTLSTAWNISTAVYASLNVSISSQTTSPQSMAVSPNGTRMYILGYNNQTVYQYNLSTAGNISTAAYASLNTQVGSQDSEPLGISFSSNGYGMYMAGYAHVTIFQYSMH